MSQQGDVAASSSMETREEKEGSYLESLALYIGTVYGNISFNSKQETEEPQKMQVFELSKPSSKVSFPKPLLKVPLAGD